LEKKIIAKFSKEMISEGFDIPMGDIDKFLTYCILQEDFLELSEAKNSFVIWEYLKSKSNEFKE